MPAKSTVMRRFAALESGCGGAEYSWRAGPITQPCHSLDHVTACSHPSSLHVLV